MPQQYSHRNGETEPPTIDDWYWFDGEFLNTFGDIAYESSGFEIVQREGGVFWVNGDNSGFEPNQLRGRFWGPVTPPREE